MKSFFLSLCQFIKHTLGHLFGHFSWQSPPWMQAIKRRPSFYSGLFAGILTLMIGGAALSYWYETRPQPLLITAQITAPDITPVTEDMDSLNPNPVTVQFGLQENPDEFDPQTVAPLNTVGQLIKKGITLDPLMPGEWRFTSYSTLTFTPAKDWPAGQTYRLSFTRSLFTKHAKLGALDYDFSTKAFKAQIRTFQFYVDPRDPAIRAGVATILFNYPVNPQDFYAKTHLQWQSSGNPIHYQATFDKWKRTAYLRTDTLPLSNQPANLLLTIDAGLTAANGPGATREAQTTKITIPDASSYFKLNNVTTAIVHNDKDEPQQVIIFDTTLGVTTHELANHVTAYLLPKDKPKTVWQASIPDYDWQNPGEVTADVLAQAEKLPLQFIPTVHDYATVHSAIFSALSNRSIYVEVKSGTEGMGHYVLQNTYQNILNVPTFPNEIRFLHAGSLMSLGGEKKISVIARGLPGIQFTLARVLPNNVNQLVTQTEGDFSDPQFLNNSFNAENISVIKTLTQAFPETKNPSKPNYIALDLGQYLNVKTNTLGPKGLFLVKAEGYNPKTKFAFGESANRLILITDLGLLVKTNADNTHEVFVQSIEKGEPVQDVTISVLGKNGLPIATAKTDAQGKAPIPDLTDDMAEKTPTVYLAAKNNDVSFMPYQAANQVVPLNQEVTGGVTTPVDLAQPLTAYLFSDRGIYRPGDAAHVGIIVKEAFAKAAPAGIPLELTVTDPRGTVIDDEKLSLNADGFFTKDLKTTASMITGNYTVNLYIVKDNAASNLLGSTILQFAEFQPDRLKINAKFIPDINAGWVAPDDLKVAITLKNLFGFNAVGNKISGNMTLNPKAITFSAYPDYAFTDPLYQDKKPVKVVTDHLSDQVTNANGTTIFPLRLNRFQKATYLLTFYAEGFEAESGRSVTTEVSTLVSPLGYFIGVKSSAALDFIRANTKVNLHFIAVNPQLKMQAVSGLTLTLSALKPISTLVKNPDGTYQYQTVTQDSMVSKTPFAIAATGTDYPIHTQNVGQYQVTLLDKEGNDLSHVTFNIVGNSVAPLSSEAKLDVKLDKQAYLPGDNITMQLTSPYAGSGLITIERDKVYAATWFKTNETSSLQHIQIPADFQGDGYVNVAFVRDFNSPDIFSNPLSTNVVPFAMNHAAETVQVHLATSKVVKPGAPLNIQYQTDKPAKIIIFAVDEGILQVANFTTPDPLAYFFQKHALEVSTAQIVDLILPKFAEARELSQIGGDNAMPMAAMFARQLNPFKRQAALPVAFWSGILAADNTAKTVTYNVPDYFNGQLRVMAVASSESAVGNAEKNTVVRGDFILSPNVPTFVAPTDTFYVSTNVANNVATKNQAIPITVSLKASAGIKILGGDTATIRLPEKGAHTVTFHVQATHALGNATLTFTAMSGEKSAAQVATLSVRPATAYITDIQSGMTKEKKTLALTRDFYAQEKYVRAQQSENPLMLVSGLTHYLLTYPYGCTEQLVSQSMPLLALSNDSSIMSDKTLLLDHIHAAIAMLTERQLSNGGFAYWPGGQNQEDPNTIFASIYGMHFLTEAKENNFAVPVGVFQSGLQFLSNYVMTDMKSLADARLHAYAIYLLTRNQLVATNALGNLSDYLTAHPKLAWQQDITSAYMAATYALLQDQAEANRLIIGFKVSKEVANYFSPVAMLGEKDMQSAQYLYLLALHFKDRLQASPGVWVLPVVEMVNTSNLNTISASFASLALTAYAKMNAAGNLPFTTLPIPPNAKEITFSPLTANAYFYQLMAAGFPTALPVSPMAAGLEVNRKYRDLHGNVVKEVKLGDEIEVHLSIRALVNDWIDNVAIVDLLPGGFEVVRESLPVDQFSAVDAREDRVNFFGGVGGTPTDWVYRIKAMATGAFIAPPVWAEAMYHPTLQAEGAASKLTVSQG